jgi:hypothetical protein
MVGLRPYRVVAATNLGELPIVHYVNTPNYWAECESSNRIMRVGFPWSDQVPELFDAGEPFHSLLLYPIRMLLESVWQQLGEYAVHASAVVRHGRAILLTGGPEAGKTTTAMHLCRSAGFSLYANDQTRMTVRNHHPWLVHGEKKINLRYSSVSRYSSAIAERVFLAPDARNEPWNLKKEVEPPSMGIDTHDLPVPLAVFANIKLDDSLNECVVHLLSSRADSSKTSLERKEEFFMKIELYRDITEVIRGARFTPLGEEDLKLRELFVPSLDRPDYMQKRVAFVNTLFEDDRMALVTVRGPLEQCGDALVRIFNSIPA